jgi:hypothetical protein
MPLPRFADPSAHGTSPDIPRSKYPFFSPYPIDSFLRIVYNEAMCGPEEVPWLPGGNRGGPLSEGGKAGSKEVRRGKPDGLVDFKPGLDPGK